MAATVEFHTGVDDPVHFACRLLRKAVLAGARTLVTAPAETLAALDAQLWTFDDPSFVAHVSLPGASAAQCRRTPVWLLGPEAIGACPAPAPRVLVNLAADPPASAGSFDRVIEIVGSGPAERQAGRQRWRHYEAWGVTPLHHNAVG